MSEPVTESSGNVFLDLGLPCAEQELRIAELRARAEILLNALYATWQREPSWGHVTVLDMLFVDDYLGHTPSAAERVAHDALQALATAVGWERPA